MPSRKPLRGLHVLVVEDDADAREIVELLLESYGATVTAAAGAVEALTVLDRRRVDCIVSDINMPERDGLWLIRQVRTRDAERPLPAVAITARVTSEDRRAILRAGFQVHVPKPIEVDHLVDAILHAVAWARQATGH